MTQLYVRFLHLILCFHLFLPPSFLSSLLLVVIQIILRSTYNLEVAVLEIKSLNSQGFCFFPLFSSALNPIFSSEWKKWEEHPLWLALLQFHCILFNLRLSLLGFVIHSSRWIQTQRNETPNVFFDRNLLFPFCTGNVYLNNKSHWILLFSDCYLLLRITKLAQVIYYCLSCVMCKISVNTCEHFLRLYLQCLCGDHSWNGWSNLLYFECRYGLFSSTHSLISLSPAKLSELLSQFNYMLQSFWVFL